MGDKFELLKTPVSRTAGRKKNKNEKLRLRVIFLDDSERVFEVEVRSNISLYRPGQVVTMGLCRCKCKSHKCLVSKTVVLLVPNRECFVSFISKLTF